MGASIAYLLPDGMRAAAVRINDVSGVAGFIQPNDAVELAGPDGKVFAKGLGTHAPAHVEYYAGGACSKLTATIGIERILVI